MKSTLTSLLAIASLATAHFTLEYPKVRDFDEDKLGEFPCGGFNAVGTRTPWPLSGGEIALKMGHSQSNVEVLIAIGDNPGDAFNTIIRPTFQQTGLGDFCMTGFSIPSSLNVAEGTNATIQVITNGDPAGGLFNCADITFSKTFTAGTCTNNTGVSVATATVSGNPNGTTSSTPSESSTAAGSATKPGSASGVKAGMGGLAVAVLAAVAMLL